MRKLIKYLIKLKYRLINKVGELRDKKLKQRIKAGQHETIVIGLQERVLWLADKKKRVDGKPDGSPGGGEAYWDGRLQEAQTIMNLIHKGDL